MDTIFDWCVDLLEYLALRVGVTYKDLNVWLFLIVQSGAIHNDGSCMSAYLAEVATSDDGAVGAN
jgi:hypothetical protein